MSSNCLERKLKGATNNPALFKLGEIRVGLNPNGAWNDNNILGITLKSDATKFPLISVNGEGYLLYNNERVKSYRLQTRSYQYVAIDRTTINADTTVSIEDCDDIVWFVDGINIGCSYTIDPNKICYISPFATRIKMINSAESLNIDSGILDRFTSLNTLILQSSNAKGNLSNLPDSITYLDISHSQISGNVSDLPQSLQTLYFIPGSLTGEIANIRDGFCYLWSGNTSSLCLWPSTTARATTKKKFGIAYINFGNDLDNMLVNMAACASNTDIPSENKLIRVFGTHTMEESVWKAAVASLKNDGFTVTINNQQQ